MVPQCGSLPASHISWLTGWLSGFLSLSLGLQTADVLGQHFSFQEGGHDHADRMVPAQNEEKQLLPKFSLLLALLLLLSPVCMDQLNQSVSQLHQDQGQDEEKRRNQPDKLLRLPAQRGENNTETVLARSEDIYMHCVCVTVRVNIYLSLFLDIYTGLLTMD